MLLGVEVLDELYSAAPSLGAPDIQREFGASYAVTAAVLLVLPGVAGMVLEPPLFVLADRLGKTWFVRGGLIGMAVAALAAAVAPSIWLVGAAMALAFVASGCAVSLSQAALIDARPGERERVMARWTLAGAIGDLAGPALVALAAQTALGWRAAFLAVAAVAALYALALGRAELPLAAERCGDGEDGDGAAVVTFWAAVRRPRLVAWSLATALCGLLDEILLVFAALHLRDDLGLEAAARSAVLGAFVAGGVAGLLALDRLLQSRSPRWILLVSSALCAASYGGWIAAGSPWVSAALLFVCGATAAPMYPVAMARAYACLPGASGTVNAVGHLFTPFAVAAPFALGWLADSAGLAATLIALLAQPLGVGIVAALDGARTTS